MVTWRKSNGKPVHNKTEAMPFAGAACVIQGGLQTFAAITRSHGAIR
jgi:hypothetical protein